MEGKELRKRALDAWLELSDSDVPQFTLRQMMYAYTNLFEELGEEEAKRIWAIMFNK